jgi:hypothetical protein
MQGSRTSNGHFLYLRVIVVVTVGRTEVSNSKFWSTAIEEMCFFQLGYAQFSWSTVKRWMDDRDYTTRRMG